MKDRKYKVTVPEGEKGSWKISRFEVTKQEAMFSIFSLKGRAPSPGIYTKLTRNGRVVMSDTPAEYRDHSYFIYKARRDGGRVLIHGLGLGMVLQEVLKEPKVEHLTVIEKSQDVIDLVANHYYEMFGRERLSIRQGDAYTWKPKKGERWNSVWHDIWDDLCVDNLPLMTKLHRRFGRRCDYQDSWGKSYLKRQRGRY